MKDRIEKLQKEASLKPSVADQRARSAGRDIAAAPVRVRAKPTTQAVRMAVRWVSARPREPRSAAARNFDANTALCGSARERGKG